MSLLPRSVGHARFSSTSAYIRPSSLWSAAFLSLLIGSVLGACESATAVPLPAQAPAQPVIPPPVASTLCDSIIQDVAIQGDIVVPDGESCLIGPNVRISGNVRTDGGTIVMRPGSSLKFVAAEPAEYVGGGMRFSADYRGDYGIWVGGTGVLDIQGTPKVGWNRTGTDPSWAPEDELWIAPTDVGDFAPRRWTPGDPIPQIDPRVPPAEIMNVTRDILIEGPAHIHISSSKPQRIEYVTLRGMGILKPSIGSDAGATTGRYALHFHMQGEGSRGTLVRGVAAIDSNGRVFVPHTSHGITFEDVVSVNSMGEAFWWDDGDVTNDITVDRLAVSGVYVSREFTGETNRNDAVAMPFGVNMVMTNSVASGVNQGRLGVGFNWDAGNRRSDTHWTFTGNVSHNNGTGIRFWNNSGQPHHIKGNIAYRNGIGLENGAYNNSNRFTDLLLIENNLGVRQNASSNESQVDGGPARFTNLLVEVVEGPALEIGGRNLASNTYAEFLDSNFYAGPNSPKILVTTGVNPWLARFIRTNVLPEDIAWDLTDGRNDGSRVIIEHADGRKWEIMVANGTVTTLLLEPAPLP
jgi:hypothetical protein